jgi:hypothetical protein
MKEKHLADIQLPKSLGVVLGAMSEKDRKRFGHYLQQDPFHPQQKLSDLYDLIVSQFFTARAPAVRWEEALRKAGIKGAQIHKQLTYLHQRLDQFLGMQQILAAPHRTLS